MHKLSADSKHLITVSGSKDVQTKMKNFLVSRLTQIATYATVIVIFTNNVLFDRDVACTCQDQKLHCNLYISVPIFIIILLLLWKDKVFNGTCRAYCCVKKRRKSQERFCHLILIQMGKASVIGLLWVVSVLFDGDWYACCHNGLQGEEAQIPCKKNRTLDEQAKVDNLKNWSKVIGVLTLLGLLSLVVCLSLLKWCKCCKKRSRCSKYCKNCSNCSDKRNKCSSCRELNKEHFSCSDVCKECSKHCQKCADCSKFRKEPSNCSDCWKKCSSCSSQRKKCSNCFNCCNECLSCSDFCEKCSKFCEKCLNCSEFRKKCSSCVDCWKKFSSCFNCCKDCVYIDGDGPYELIIIQEEENVVNQILKERAKEALKQKVQEMVKKGETNNYINCSDAAQQVIDQLWLQEEKGPSGDQSNDPSADPVSQHTDTSMHEVPVYLN
ncbi:uncharacterized protein LOC103155876 isoform X1 [Poecilia formosa]|uniref:uncharacterized protein LOC103155876 isoform X1 n=1 Tax=Poecilia formosa TaxID=48698 RepID=UPI0007B90996|nr:PREDICTED: uncharacterized protein LOC103155876 isoform X1 [Poecilia formosa]